MLRCKSPNGSCGVDPLSRCGRHKAYESDAKAFEEKVTGRGRVNAFFRAVPTGRRYLLKLPGNIDNAAKRVLNADEYAAAYGNEVVAGL